jgi:hypothetical protein
MRLFRSRGLLCLAALPVFSLSARAAGSGHAFNPDISVNFLGLAQYGTAYSSNRSASPHNGFTLQEAEMQFLSDVDPYFRASALFAVEQEDGESGYGIDPEEVFLETISLPVVTVKAGKFKMALGRHNQLHTHAFPFIDAPLINQKLLGDEGLNESGVSVAALLPFSWYSELTLQGMTLSNEELFTSASSGDYGALVHFKNLWDLTDSSTVELGLSGLSGNNQFGKKSSVVGADLTMKWRPTVGGKYHALIWSTEYLLGERNGFTADRGDPASPGSTLTESTKELGGLATWLQYQFAERWWAQARYEYVGLPKSTTPSLAKVDKQSALLAFLPSEFSGLRLQYDRIHDQSRPRIDHTIAFQYNVTIGAHPAHAY